MTTVLNILLVEDSESDADLLIRFLNRQEISFSHTRVWSKEAFEKAITENHHDLIISDQSLPQFSGMEAFRLSKSLNKNIPFILITGTVSETLLSEFAKEGIDDYLLKDNLLRLPSAIKNIISNKKIEELHKKLEKAHKDIQDSINYAKKIQTAMLPEKEILSSVFPESFVYFKPKDVLSGDFYWLKKQGDILYVAVADCTGHGVPGALLSIICSEKLDEALVLTCQPDEILSHLNLGIKNFLHQSDKDDSTKDGMDIALCAINGRTKKLSFSGANRPLYLVRRGRSELEEIKATRKAIGGNTDDDQQFLKFEMTLSEGDSIYMSTDGYADQFGGVKEKKLMSKSFKKVILAYVQESLLNQGRLLENFMNKWKEGQEQVDDMLVIGIKI